MFNCSNLFNLFNVQICSICSMFKFVQCSNLFKFSMFNFPMVTDSCRCELSRRVLTGSFSLGHLNFNLDTVTFCVQRSRTACDKRTNGRALSGQTAQKKFKLTDLGKTISWEASVRHPFVRFFKILFFWHNASHIVGQSI